MVNVGLDNENNEYSIKNTVLLLDDNTTIGSVIRTLGVAQGDLTGVAENTYSIPGLGGTPALNISGTTVLDETSAIQQSSYPGLDFNTKWRMEPGKPPMLRSSQYSWSDLQQQMPQLIEFVDNTINVDE
jgi:hypothetical protein